MFPDSSAAIVHGVSKLPGCELAPDAEEPQISKSWCVFRSKIWMRLLPLSATKRTLRFGGMSSPRGAFNSAGAPEVPPETHGNGAREESQPWITSSVLESGCVK